MNDKNRRIARNTVMLYFRQAAILLVSLWTVRMTLKVLGETDYGLYTVVAGIVTMFTMFSGAMASASQRFFSFALGRKDYDGLRNIFSMTLIIYAVIIVAAILLMEIGGLWFVSGYLSVPKGRETAVIWIYEANVFSLVCTLITTPYMALIIAHENMDVYAVISIIEAALKVFVVIAVGRMPGDKLAMYGILTALSTFAITFLYRFYCRRSYQESRYKSYWDKGMFKEIFSFTTWNLFGSSVGAFKIQGVNIILNQSFSQIVVASRGIASSVGTAVISFSQSFGTAIRPVIIKEYAAENYEKVNALIGSASKLTFLLMYIFILPLAFEIHTVLKIWLGNVPVNAALYTVLTLIDALIDSVSYPLMTAAQATGKIRLYQTIVGGIQLSNLPISMIAVLLGSPAYGVFVIAIILTFLSFAVRILILSKIMSFHAGRFIKHTILPLICATIVTVWVPYGITLFFEQSLIRILATSFLSLVSICIVFWLIVADKNEKVFIVDFIKEKRGRLR